MSEDISKKYDEELENEFSNADLALDIDENNEETSVKSGRFSKHFQEEFKAAFEEVPEAKEKRKKKKKEKTIKKNPNAEKFEVVKEDGFIAGAYDWIRCVIFAIAIVVVCLTFLFRLVEVDGTSMDDTLNNHDRVIVTNLFYTPHESDIVVISHAEKYNKPLIKRVIATEGQSIKLDYENDRVIVDGVVLSEPYIDGSAFANNKGNYNIPEIVPKGKVFVMGDNRKVSLDSRNSEIGLIDVSNVIGKAQYIAFPFDRFKYLY